MQYADLFRGTGEPYQSLLLGLSDVSVSADSLGQGFHSRVFLGRMQAPAQHRAWQRLSTAAGQGTAPSVAVKVVAQVAEGGLEAETAISAALLEARLHAQMDHPNLVRLVGVQEARQPVMLVLEYCEHGDLLNMLRARAAGGGNAAVGRDFTPAQRRDMAAQSAAGLRYLHSKLVVHRDVAARNVLLTSTGAASAGAGAGPGAGSNAGCGYVLKISDLGMSRQLTAGSDYYRSQSDDAVPLRWQCPEAIATRVYTAKSDVYSYGVLLYEIYSGGATPFGQLRSVEVLRAVKAGEVLSRPRADTPEDVVGLMRQCTRLDVGSRPSMATVHAQLTGAWLVDNPVAGRTGEPGQSGAAPGPAQGLSVNAAFGLAATAVADDVGGGHASDAETHI